MKLELEVNGEERIFTITHATARHHRQVMEFDEKIDYSSLGVDEVDELVGFVCDVFRNQFTVDEFYDGMKSHELISTITDTFIFIRTGKTSEELEAEELGNEKGD